jgi:deazaflavin-dependent oxidoreductase (nitroreductase family)
MSDATAPQRTRYIRPGGLTDKVFNRVVAALTKAGISVWGSRVLAVRGRKSGEWRTTPVNLLILDGERYLVAPRGHTQWVRNMRVAGGGELRLGRRTEVFHAVEVADAEKPSILREYLRRWAWEVGIFFKGEGITVDSPESDLLRVAPGFPVFRITAAPAAPEATEAPAAPEAGQQD